MIPRITWKNSLGKYFLSRGLFKGQFFRGVGRAIACRYGCGNGGEGSCGGGGGDSAVQPHSKGGVGDTDRNTHRNVHAYVAPTL